VITPPACRWPWLAVFAATALAACAAVSSAVGERLDPVTGVTVTFTETPLVLYRDEPARAAYARTFVNIAPLLVNRSADRRYYLWIGIWNTVVADDAVTQRDGFESIAVFIDGEPLFLELAGWTPDVLGVSEPVYVKPVASAVDAYYEITPDQVRRIAAASDVRLRTGGTNLRSYEPWDGQSGARESLQRFAELTAY
jgi:hypothetical protein